MKKIIISVICITLLVALFAGCTQSPTKPANENIIGLWDMGDDWYWLFEEGGISYQGSYVDWSGDGTTEDIIEEVKDSVQYHYKLEDGVLSASGNETFPEDQTLNYSYTFNGDDSLKLDGIDTINENLNRVK